MWLGGEGRGIGVVWHLEWGDTGGCVGDCQGVEVVDSRGGPVKIWWDCTGADVTGFDFCRGMA